LQESDYTQQRRKECKKMIEVRADVWYCVMEWWNVY
jgi:hypothetical protein